LAKVTKTVSAEMLLVAAPKESLDRPLPANRGKPWAATSFAGLTLSLHYPASEKLLCLAHFTALPVSPGFFPKLLCGRPATNIFQAIAFWIFRTVVVTTPTPAVLT